MEVGKLAENVTVSGQITEAQVEILHANGVEQIVCNRPDGESGDQTPFEVIAAKAASLGIEAISIPFSGSNMTREHVDAFHQVLQQGKVMHMYCRTGNRCTVLWNTTKSMFG